MKNFFVVIVIFALVIFPISIIAWIIQAIRKKPTKKIKIACLVVFVAFVLGTIGGMMSTCKHEWQDATCTSPNTCLKCGETEGEPLGHAWKAATCTEPETCVRCGETRGIAKGHEWKDATCTEPKTCKVCGETEGDTLGHKEGDWEVTEVDMVKATEVLKKYCTVCGEQLDRKKRDMDSLHDTYHFLMTPKEFVSRLDNKLQSIADSNLRAFTGSSGDNFGCAIVDGKTTEKVGVFLFVGDGESIYESQKNTVCFDGSFGSIQGSDSIALTILAIVETCDPSLSFSEAKDLGVSILRQGEVTKNGITYLFSYADDGAMICFALAD